MIIPRKEIGGLETKNWIFVFGRRKTGKSFLVKNFGKWDEYFFVKRNRSILSEKGGNLSYETFIELLKRGLEDNKTLVIDEFHRFGNDFLDYLHSLRRNGRLIIISSTLFLAKKLLGIKSPILGLFSEMPIKIINLEDTLAALKKFNINKKDYLESAVVLREPIVIKPFEEKTNVRRLFSRFLLDNINSIPAFVGEIFLEEEKTLSAIYEGIMRAISAGKINSTEISGYLFSKKLIANNDPSIVQQYLKNLIDFGIIKKIGVYNKNKFIFRHISPIIWLFYYADEKYNISERETTEQEIERIVAEVMPHIIEDNIREFFAYKYGLRESIIEAKDYDIDGCLLKFKKPEILLEIKWKKLDREDIKKAEENLSRINAKRKILFVQDKKDVKSNLEVLDVSDLTKL